MMSSLRRMNGRETTTCKKKNNKQTEAVAVNVAMEFQHLSEANNEGLDD